MWMKIKKATEGCFKTFVAKNVSNFPTFYPLCICMNVIYGCFLYHIFIQHAIFADRKLQSFEFVKEKRERKRDSN